MSSPFSIRLRRWIAGAAFVAALATPVPATITDDVNPMDYYVVVTLWNPDSQPASGVVSVTSLAGGASATASAPFHVSAHDRVVVRVRFTATVTQVLEVSIIDDEPDPM